MTLPKVFSCKIDLPFPVEDFKLKRFLYRPILCQLTPFSAFFSRPSPILLKFGMFVGLDEKMSDTKFQVSKSNSF